MRGWRSERWRSHSSAGPLEDFSSLTVVSLRISKCVAMPGMSLSKNRERQVHLTASTHIDVRRQNALASSARIARRVVAVGNGGRQRGGGGDHREARRCSADRADVRTGILVWAGSRPDLLHRRPSDSRLRTFDRDAQDHQHPLRGSDGLAAWPRLGLAPLAPSPAGASAPRRGSGRRRPLARCLGVRREHQAVVPALHHLTQPGTVLRRPGVVDEVTDRPASWPSTLEL